MALCKRQNIFLIFANILKYYLKRKNKPKQESKKNHFRG